MDDGNKQLEGPAAWPLWRHLPERTKDWMTVGIFFLIQVMLVFAAYVQK